VDYLKSRGLTGVIARDFGLGYAPPGWDNLHKVLARDEGGEALALKTGMLVKNDAGRTYDRFRDRIVFPIRDRRGRVIAFGGRVLGDDKPKYLNSPETPIFHKGRELYGLYEARRANRTLSAHHRRRGLHGRDRPCPGRHHQRRRHPRHRDQQEHLQRIFRVVPEVVFCFDGDAPDARPPTAPWRPPCRRWRRAPGALPVPRARVMTRTRWYAARVSRRFSTSSPRRAARGVPVRARRRASTSPPWKGGRRCQQARLPFIRSCPRACTAS
jgi:hypothetical protein